jgi:hypothetical protein
MKNSLQRLLRHPSMSEDHVCLLEYAVDTTQTARAELSCIPGGPQSPGASGISDVPVPC